MELEISKEELETVRNMKYKIFDKFHWELKKEKISMTLEVYDFEIKEMHLVPGDYRTKKVPTIIYKFRNVDDHGWEYYWFSYVVEEHIQAGKLKLVA